MYIEHIESAIIAAAVRKQRRLPVDLGLIADQVGADIRYTSHVDTFTSFQSSGPVICVSNTQPSSEKRRFIVAHELAHVILRKAAVIDLIERRGQATLLEDEESLANRIAGALLVPDNWVESMKRRRLAPVRLREIADLAGIPISMLVTRLCESGIDIALLHWRRVMGSWCVVERPGTPLLLHGCIEISALARRTLDHLGSGESEVTLDCRASGIWTRIGGRSFRSGCHDEHVLHFLEPEKDISFSR